MVKKENLLLIDSNYLIQEFRPDITISSSLLSIASMLEKYNYKTKIIDLSALVKRGRLKINKKFHQSVAEFIIQKNPRFIGFSTRCDTYPMIINIAKRCKRIVPECKVILGGPQATFTDIDTLREFPFIDVIVRGEGEITIVELMRKLEDKGKLEDVDGITYRENGKIIRNKDREPIKDLDSLPLPAYHLIEEHLPSSKEHDRLIRIIVGRGCRYRCKFCSLGGVLPRMRTPKFIFKEIKLLKEKYGFKRFSLDANSFLSHKEKAKQVCNLLIKEKLNIKWGTSVRIDDIDADSIKIMSEAGCRCILLGIETGSLKIQKHIHKKLSFSSIFKCLSLCEEFNILPKLTFIIGFPEERKEDVKSTIGLALKLRNFAQCHIEFFSLNPLPGTNIFEKNKNRMIFINRFNSFTITYPFINRLRENVILIKKYPLIFSSFYTIRPRYFSISCPHEITIIFNNLLFKHSSSCYLAMKELRLTPIELIQKIKRWMKKNKIDWENDFTDVKTKGLFQSKINKYFPDFIKALYIQYKITFKFLRMVIGLEKKKFNILKKAIKPYL